MFTVVHTRQIFLFIGKLLGDFKLLIRGLLQVDNPVTSKYGTENVTAVSKREGMCKNSLSLSVSQTNVQSLRVSDET
jgi:hypothetical protein